MKKLMKKLIFIIALNLSLSVQAVELDRFINPLFYKEMKPYSRIMSGMNIFLTPTSVIQADASSGNCQLIDQSQTRVLFKCKDDDPNRYNYPDDFITHYLFILVRPDTEQNRCDIRVYRKSFQEIKLDYDIYSRKLAYTYHYIETDDCGVTENVDPLQGYDIYEGPKEASKE